MRPAREQVLEIARRLPASPGVLAQLWAVRPLAGPTPGDDVVAAVLARHKPLAAWVQATRARANRQATAGAGHAAGFDDTLRLAGAWVVRELGSEPANAPTVATLAEEFARAAGEDAATAFVAGLLHALAPGLLASVAGDPAAVAALLAHWGFPPRFADAFAARGENVPPERVTRLVHLAASWAQGSDSQTPELTSIHAAALAGVGLSVLQGRGARERAWARRAGLVERLAAAGAEPARDSCNFSGGSGVVQPNDEPPVHTTEAGVSPAPDFTTFMRNYQDMVFSTAARLTGNDAQAEDISQEVFLKAYENFDHLRTSPTAGGWLKTVATNLSLNHLSRYRNRWRFFSEFRREQDADDREVPDVEFAAPDTFFTGLDAAERRSLVEQALAQLPEHQRVPLVLYHFEDLPYDEIAKRLRISLAKVKTDILRARAALAKILSRSGTAHEKPFPERA